MVSNFLESYLVNVFLVKYIPTVTKDAVDAMLEQWERERSDLDATATGILGRISRISALVDQEMDRVFQPHGLSGGDFVVLAALRRSGEPYQLTPTALSRSMMVSSGGTTGSKPAVSSAAIPIPPTGAARSSRSPVMGLRP